MKPLSHWVFLQTLWKIPSRELTYPTLGKRTSSSKSALERDMLVPRKVWTNWHFGDKPIIFAGSCFPFQSWSKIIPPPKKNLHFPGLESTGPQNESNTHIAYITPSLEYLHTGNLTVRPWKMGRNPKRKRSSSKHPFSGAMSKNWGCIYIWYHNVLLPNVAYIDPNISPNFSSWWIQPTWKILVKVNHFPR